MKLLIKNSRLVDYKTDKIGDLLIEDGSIKKIEKKIEEDKNIKVLDGKGRLLMPSFIDTHAHFREPGFEYKETLESGSRAALKGGYTAVLLMGNTKPAASSREIIKHILKKGDELDLIDILQAGTMTKDIKGESFNHLKDIKNVVKMITDDGMGVSNNRIMFEIMKYSKKNNLIVMSHAEDPSFSEYNMRMAENIMTYRDIELGKITGCRLHFAHVSTKEAAQRIIKEKNDYPNITFEVTPHHIFSNDSIKYKVNPPFRTERDRKYLVECIKKGYVDCIGTDHAPHSKEDKEKGAPGISGIEIAFQLLYTKLVEEEGLSLCQLSKIISKKPAEILELNKGKLEEGYDGDVVMIDENAESFIDTNKFKSKGKNNPFHGRKVYGKVLMTFRKGRLMYEEGEKHDSR